MTSQQTPREDDPNATHGSEAPRGSEGLAPDAPESGTDPVGEGVGADDLEARVAEAEASAAEHRDLYLRARAEADNIRRRAENEVANARKFAIESFAREMLAVRDSLELARGAEPGEGAADGALERIREGLDLTLKLMDKGFNGFGVETVAPEKGDRFDPERHQAMSAQPTDELPPNHILAVIQRGYRIHERLLRPAMVIVARAAEPADTAGEDDSGAGSS